MDEFGIIAEIFAPLATAPFAFGLKDDAAAIPPRLRPTSWWFSTSESTT